MELELTEEQSKAVLAHLDKDLNKAVTSSYHAPGLITNAPIQAVFPDKIYLPENQRIAHNILASKISLTDQNMPIPETKTAIELNSSGNLYCQQCGKGRPNCVHIAHLIDSGRDSNFMPTDGILVLPFDDLLIDVEIRLFSTVFQDLTVSQGITEYDGRLALQEMLREQMNIYWMKGALIYPEAKDLLSHFDKHCKHKKHSYADRKNTYANLSAGGSVRVLELVSLYTQALCHTCNVKNKRLLALNKRTVTSESMQDDIPEI